MSDERTEPAIPVKAAVRIESLQDLLMTAARQWPETKENGALVSWDITAQRVAVTATLTMHDWEGGVVGQRTWDGHWEVGGFVRWTPRQ